MKIIFILLFLMFSASICSQELEADFELQGNLTTVKEGDLVEGQLKIWPIESASTEDFQDFKKGYLLNGFHLLNLISLAPSENNSDVYILKGLYVVKKEKQFRDTITFKDRVIVIKSASINIIELKNKTKEYFILDQGSSSSVLALAVILIAVLILVFIIFWKKTIIFNKLNFKKKTLQELEVEHYSKLFLEAKSRSELEKIYQDKMIWIKHVKVMAPAYQEFFNIINAHQYKKEWKSEELTEVLASFEIIRRSFK